MIEKTFNCGAIFLNQFPIALAFLYNFFANFKLIFLGYIGCKFLKNI